MTKQGNLSFPVQTLGIVSFPPLYFCFLGICKFSPCHAVPALKWDGQGWRSRTGVGGQGQGRLKSKSKRSKSFLGYTTIKPRLRSDGVRAPCKKPGQHIPYGTVRVQNPCKVCMPAPNYYSIYYGPRWDPLPAILRVVGDDSLTKWPTVRLVACKYDGLLNSFSFIVGTESHRANMIGHLSRPTEWKERIRDLLTPSRRFMTNPDRNKRSAHLQDLVYIIVFHASPNGQARTRCHETALPLVLPTFSNVKSRQKNARHIIDTVHNLPYLCVPRLCSYYSNYF